MIKKTLMSIMVIGITVSMIAGTMPFLSDTENSSGNSFSAGILDLEVNNQNPLDSPVITMSHVEFCCYPVYYENIILHMTGNSNPAKVKMHIFNVVNHSGYMGCSPGFWKNHPYKWVKYPTEDTIGSVFELPSELEELSSKTLIEALDFHGGKKLADKAKILLKHAVAGVLNAVHPDINYPLPESDVINQVNDALASLDKDAMDNLKNTLDYYNNLGCSFCGSNNDLSEHIEIDLKLINTSSGEEFVIISPDEHKTLAELECHWINITGNNGYCNDYCDEGEKPYSLTMQYTGENCSASNHHQDPSKVDCGGDPSFESPVHIIATDKSDINDPKAKIWFDGMVSLNEEFIINATNCGETKLKANTYVFIYNVTNGALLQMIKFHTSCSQPLFEGDQFGSLKLVGFVSECDHCGHCNEDKEESYTPWLYPCIDYILEVSIHPCNICHFYWGASVTFDIEFYAEWGGLGLNDVEESDGNSITVWG